ncbi:HSP20-like chaperones superfamily protein [Actinidia rufa]|uniref:Co-chaperone protein p23 n=1 Tax=Actinidia rufa TaxID=165716 RepID=A0A7J0DQ66_9ERIC|nr:HSP20-like chaperones superfamily protein [Actinidia rufa]
MTVAPLVHGNETGFFQQSRLDNAKMKGDLCFGVLKPEIEYFLIFYFLEMHTRCHYCRHPEVKWAQRPDKVYVTVLLPDAKNAKVNFEPDGVFTFSASAGADNYLYELKLDLFDKVNVEESKINIGLRSIFCVLEKAEPKWWKKLLRGDDKVPHYVKVDWDKWVDEDDETGPNEPDMGGMDFSKFGDMGGMGNMMGGMGGMGGMGDMMGGMGGMMMVVLTLKPQCNHVIKYLCCLLWLNFYAYDGVSRNWVFIYFLCWVGAFRNEGIASQFCLKARKQCLEHQTIDRTGKGSDEEVSKLEEQDAGKAGGEAKPEGHEAATVKLWLHTAVTLRCHLYIAAAPSPFATTTCHCIHHHYHREATTTVVIAIPPPPPLLLLLPPPHSNTTTIPATSIS